MKIAIDYLTYLGMQRRLGQLKDTRYITIADLDYSC